MLNQITVTQVLSQNMSAGQRTVFGSYPPSPSCWEPKALPGSTPSSLSHKVGMLFKWLIAMTVRLEHLTLKLQILMLWPQGSTLLVN